MVMMILMMMMMMITAVAGGWRSSWPDCREGSFLSHLQRFPSEGDRRTLEHWMNTVSISLFCQIAYYMFNIAYEICRNIITILWSHKMPQITIILPHIGLCGNNIRLTIKFVFVFVLVFVFVFGVQKKSQMLPALILLRWPTTLIGNHQVCHLFNISPNLSIILKI